MLRFICIFGLLFLMSFQEVTIPNFSRCQSMVLSDALPVQFWLSDCDTYNETVPKGVHEACFCAPWQCDDEIKIQFTDTDTTPDTEYSLSVQDSSDNVLATIDFSYTGSGEYFVSFVPDDYAICNDVIKLLIINDTTATTVAKSDCLNVATTQDETELIEYSNERDFAGLIYADISPEASFKIRIPCRFFHERFPEEDEAMELTSSIITTSAQIKSQKLLEVKHAPYYFHKKLQLVLKHHTLEIGGIAYKKEEKYEVNEGNKRWPLKSATCLLTEKNSVLRNVL